jgi:hypothetical protein
MLAPEKWISRQNNTVPRAPSQPWIHERDTAQRIHAITANDAKIVG